MNDYERQRLRHIAQNDARCSICAFFKAKPGTHQFGYCCRYAPRPHVQGEHTHWPEVPAVAWCGNWMGCTDFDDAGEPV